ncbi:MAG: 1-deoxy-D-xylulose-5-phosphate reductoisomerase [Elusimicrobiota bacterium]|jgi:1-deoxy-D-xylulose-5-phosphate reductoisomerase|nr:1-deoxy-D-xylulose-5-phosphate reductoisomerase [Elusimicrobiota bacterium]
MPAKQIVILGSTGSIGVSALDVIDALGPNYQVLAVTGNTNTDLFLRQIKKFRPRYAAVYSEESYHKIKDFIPPHTQLLGPGAESLVYLSVLPAANLVINGLVGAAGFMPLVAAIKAGKTIALANKEPIVMAGRALMDECRRWNATIIPVDSEPSAVFQSLENTDTKTYFKAAQNISCVLLTASGGPFYKKRVALSKVTPAQALNHPRWKMGKKITIDSSTLMNKGFEEIEIMHLFALPLEKIKIVVHPQSIVHSAVEYLDGSILAQMSNPDMRLPIQYAVTYPQRQASPVKKLSIKDISRLTFDEPDLKKFPCLSLALEAAEKGGGYPAVLNAADEIAVNAFLEDKILFTDIHKIVQAALSAYKPGPGGKPVTLTAAVEIDGWARQKAREVLDSRSYSKI